MTQLRHREECNWNAQCGPRCRRGRARPGTRALRATRRSGQRWDPVWAGERSWVAGGTGRAGGRKPVRRRLQSKRQGTRGLSSGRGREGAGLQRQTHRLEGRCRGVRSCWGGSGCWPGSWWLSEGGTQGGRQLWAEAARVIGQAGCQPAEGEMEDVGTWCRRLAEVTCPPVMPPLRRPSRRKSRPAPARQEPG